MRLLLLTLTGDLYNFFVFVQNFDVLRQVVLQAILTPYAKYQNFYLFLQGFHMYLLLLFDQFYLLNIKKLIEKIK